MLSMSSKCTLLGLALILLVGTSATSTEPPPSTFNTQPAQESPRPPVMEKVLFNDTDMNGAVCLDGIFKSKASRNADVSLPQHYSSGSPAGFYFVRASNPENAKKWLIYFEGGGWCYSLADCATRAGTYLGSSTKWAKQFGLTGIVSTNSSVSAFATWNHVVIGYCDGGSFSGDRAEPLEYNGQKLYFRGRSIIETLFSTLRQSEYGFNDAAEVMLSGCSAGGLSVLFHADYIGRNHISPGVKYRAVAQSSYFLDHANTDGDYVYGEQMRNVFFLQNSTSGVDQDCIADTTPEQSWKCIFAENNYPYISTPIFLQQSVHDAWQTKCILAATAVPFNYSGNGDCSSTPGWTVCPRNVQKCSSPQLEVMNGYANDMLTAITSVPTFQRPGNGGFLIPCYSHCAGSLFTYWDVVVVQGVRMNDSVAAWWNSPDGAPSSAHTYLPCTWNTTQPFNCNPTCPICRSTCWT